MLRILLILIWFCSTSVLITNEPRPVFGVKISYQLTGQITTYIVYSDNGVYKTPAKILTENEFIHFASGTWPSIYNPKRLNLFELNKLSCGVVKDSFTRKDINYCVPLDSLWKIRFEKNPINVTLGNGWSHKPFKPSPGQEVFLYHEYGVKQIDGDYFLDTSFWKLLHNVQDPKWIKNYKSIY